MIIGFASRETEKVFRREFSKKLPREIQQRAFTKFNAVDAATKLDDLRLPPSNHLEALSGNLRGQHSIRINDQWRICFRWTAAGADDVEIEDYH